MKVIDLLNKIANGEDVPEKFRFAGQIFEKQGSYIEDADGDSIFDSMFTDFSNINDEIEIIEEDKKITTLENEKCHYDYATYDSYKDKIDKTLYLIRALNLLETKIDVTNDKINEIIDKINSMEVK